jgi:proteasome lid subunit RPN8/RPN11
MGEVVGIVHSHPNDVLEFSETDKASCIAMETPFYLVCPNLDKMIVITPDEINADKN